MWQTNLDRLCSQLLTIDVSCVNDCSSRIELCLCMNYVLVDNFIFEFITVHCSSIKAHSIDKFLTFSWTEWILFDEMFACSKQNTKRTIESVEHQKEKTLKTLVDLLLTRFFDCCAMLVAAIEVKTFLVCSCFYSAWHFYHQNVLSRFFNKEMFSDVCKHWRIAVLHLFITIYLRER
jgi:hypothetical protein